MSIEIIKGLFGQGGGRGTEEQRREEFERRKKDWIEAARKYCEEKGYFKRFAESGAVEALNGLAGEYKLKVHVFPVAVAAVANNSTFGPYIEIEVNEAEWGKIKAIHPSDSKPLRETLPSKVPNFFQFLQCQAKLRWNRQYEENTTGDWQESYNEITAIRFPDGEYLLKIGRHREEGPSYSEEDQSTEISLGKAVSPDSIRESVDKAYKKFFGITS